MTCMNSKPTTKELIESLLDEFVLDDLNHILALTQTGMEEWVYMLFELMLDIDGDEAILIVEAKIEQEESRIQAIDEEQLIYEI